jgi:hypothetical protein
LYSCKEQCKCKSDLGVTRFTEDTVITGHMNEHSFVIIPADSTDNRPTFNILFKDGKVLESMYAEEIAVSLIENKWQYNEDFRIDTSIVN